MKDGIIKGTGNSRYLKSSISASTTLAQLITMLRNGTFPVDFNGINENGWQQLGTALNKANLLSDSTKNSIGLTQSDPTIDNALSKLRSLITTAQSTASGKAQMQTGYYTGTGKYGASNPITLTFNFTPKVVFVFGESDNRGVALTGYGEGACVFIKNVTLTDYSGVDVFNVSWGANKMSWYSSEYYYLNSIGTKYHWCAFAN